MAYDKKRFLNMLAAGLCSKGRTGKQLPTTYIAASQIEPNGQYGAQKMFYNGTLLPGLPDWDKVTYPYVTIHTKTSLWMDTYQTETRTIIYFSDNPHYVSADGTGLRGGAIILEYQLRDNVWEYMTKHEWTTGLGMPIDAVVYTNYDLLDENGTLYLAASEPVPAFSYNDTVLLELPEWDKEEYPYAVIAHNVVSDTVLLLLSDVPFLAEHDGTMQSPYKEAYVVTDGEWQDYFWPGAVSYVWTNTDILNEDGSIYLAASDPIPVYE